MFAKDESIHVMTENETILKLLKQIKIHSPNETVEGITETIDEMFEYYSEMVEQETFRR